MPAAEGSPGRLPPERQTRAVPARAARMAVALRPVMRSRNSRREKTATQTGAVYSSTTAVAPPLSLMEYCMAPKKTPTPQTPKAIKASAWSGRTRSAPVSPACRKNRAQPSAARQKAVSSGATPACRQNLESTPSRDQSRAASKIQI